MNLKNENVHTPLRGISWDHPRGLDPLTLTVADYCAKRPLIDPTWEARSLQNFGEESITSLAHRYDLMVIDHPFVGTGVAEESLVPLDEYLDPEVIVKLRHASVGPSLASYEYAGHLWALPVDAAAQVSVWRPDLLDGLELKPPHTWLEVFDFIHELRRHGLVAAMPMIHTDLVPGLYSIAASHGTPPFRAGGGSFLDRCDLDQALDMMLALRDNLDQRSLSLNPPQLLDIMATEDRIAYCPMAFGYSNYSRLGFRRHTLQFGDLPSASGNPHGSTLGGAGIAVSAKSPHREDAVEYATWLASAPIQAGRYFENGGQPAHRDAWTSEAVNASVGGFFTRTLSTLDEAFLRPTWPGYLGFQDAIGPPLYEYMTDRITRADLRGLLDAAWQTADDTRSRCESAQPY